MCGRWNQTEITAIYNYRATIFGGAKGNRWSRHMFRTVALGVIASVSITAVGLPASAETWISINQRQRLLDDRIDAGVRSGQLTAPEAARLRVQFHDLANLEARYRVGGLSSWERRDLDRRFDQLSRNIRVERHDEQAAQGWFGGRGWLDRRGVWMSVNARQRELDRRIDTGVRSGRLTANEAQNLRHEYRRIARLERRYRRNGLSNSERADLDRRFDQLASHIRWEATDSQLGYGYRH